jgi:hypothetical protein
MPIEETSFLTPLGIEFIVVACALMLILPRRYALAPVVILTCYMTMGEDVLIGGLHFTMIRILVLVGWLRILIRGEILKGLRMNPIDKMFLAWVTSNFILNTILWHNSQQFINRLGFAYNAIGMYFLFRFLVRDVDDVRRLFKMTAPFIIPLALIMIHEKQTDQNVFAVFGVVDPITRIREGVLRCQGPFAHPILAGTFGATLLPYFLALWWQKGINRVLAIMGVLASFIICYTTGSSGPMFALIAGILGFAAWRIRTKLYLVRRGIVLGLVCLQAVMKAPVWFILQHLSLFSGSTGDQRALLIDRAAHHFFEWVLFGTRNTFIWGPDQNMTDITNTYIFQGVEGGLLTMILFIAVMVRCYRGVGVTVSKMEDKPLADRICVWALGAALFAHTLNFISIQYFDQNIVNWYLLLAMISTVSGTYLLEKQTAEGRVPFLREAVGGRTAPSWKAKNSVSPPSRNQLRRGW